MALWANAVGIAQLPPDTVWDLTLNEYNKVMKAAYVRCGLEESKPEESPKAVFERLERDYGGTSRSLKARGHH